ncbi:MAG: PQQ-binding-like beta-propeller repeat protein [Candidatus Sabulitectum sp.]|nr:PQQ-binding-like beta-propeller repeat protein [Candidatus Sabulitectum sp.]
MLILFVVITALLSVTDVEITEPEHCAAYNLDELPAFRAIVENDNVIPDSVHYALNGELAIQVPRLSTDWPTYMQSYLHHGFSESPAPTDATILWTAPVTGDSHEFPTPVVVDGIVYYPSNSGTDSLYALDATTGELIWKRRVGYTDDAVTYYDGRVYSASDSIFCFDSQTGAVCWVSGAADWCGSTPVVTGERVFCGTGPSGSGQGDSSSVVCLDILDGSLIWSRTLYDASLISCMTVWNDLVIVPTNLRTGSSPISSPLYALDRETGETIWMNSDSPVGYWDSSPVIVDGIIYIVDEAVAARAIDAMSGETVWVSSYGSGAEATPAYHDGRLYYGQAEYFCLNALTGNGIWTVPGNQHGSSAIADGMVFYGQINYPDNGGLRALDCETGEEVWSYYPPNTYWIAGSPSVVDGIVYMPMHDWNLYAFGTGLKYTYTSDQLNSVVGWNELITTSYYAGEVVASETISYYINSTGIEFAPSLDLELTGHPNPFFASTSISFTLADVGFTSIGIYDLSGRIVSELMEETLSAGNHTIEWNGCYQNGELVSGGLYFCRIEHSGVVETTGLCVLK